MTKKIVKIMTILTITIGLLSTNAFAVTDKKNDDALYFYLVRHGQTYSNIKEMTIGGGGNAQLTAKGRYDARSLGVGLKDVNFIAAYSSTLGRAYETADNILAGRDMSITQIADLKDISWGNAEGGRIEDLTNQYGHSGNDFEFYFGKYTDANFSSPVKTENMYDFSKRFDSALRSIAKKHQNESGNILVVAHSSMAFYLQKYRPELPLSGLSNTSVSVLEYKNGNFKLIDFNNTDYLNKGYELEKSLPALEIDVIINPKTILHNVGVMEGRTDSDLTKEGIAVSKKIAKQLSSSTFITAYSSTLGRARETNSIVLQNSNTPIIYDNNLNEIFLGRWEAEKINTIKSDKTAEAKNLFSAKRVLNFKAPYGGENGDIAAYRLTTILQKMGLKYEFSQGKILVFTHPIIFRAFLNQMVPDYNLAVTKQAQIITLNYKNEKFSVAKVQEINP